MEKIPRRAGEVHGTLRCERRALLWDFQLYFELRRGAIAPAHFASSPSMGATESSCGLSRRWKKTCIRKTTTVRHVGIGAGINHYFGRIQFRLENHSQRKQAVTSRSGNDELAAVGWPRPVGGWSRCPLFIRCCLPRGICILFGQMLRRIWALPVPSG